ncbi:MAG: pitrilysin family protein [Candidatus Melainabacteria bacterium]|nr:pitrilysin family protein [Candidatus Melainabacteria bacterium]
MMTTKIVKTIALSLLLGAMSMPVAPAIAAESQTVSKDEMMKIKNPLIPITKDVTLKNGLRVIVCEDHSAPVASMCIIYDVGSRDEVKGKSGFAHLFEHMMFEGSANAPKGAFFKYVQAAGGNLNASTHNDFTDYYEVLPSNQIEIAMWLESDRMKSLAVTEKNFENQLQAVKEEKRLRIDNKPYVPAELKLEETVFDNWNNAHPVIGYFEDLESTNVATVKEFFDTYYMPANAVLVVAGDVDSNNIEALAKKYFETITSKQAKEIKRPDLTEPVQSKAKYLEVKDSHAKLPAFWMAWKAPKRRDKDSLVLNIIQNMLSTGTSSRLYQRMIKDDQVALSVDGSYEERRGPSQINFFVLYKPNQNKENVRKILLEEINKLKTGLVSEVELQKAKNLILSMYFSSNSHYSLQKSLGRAETVAQYASFYGDPGLFDKDLATYLSITPDDVKRVANSIFNENGITVVDVTPDASGQEGEAQ